MIDKWPYGACEQDFATPEQLAAARLERYLPANAAPELVAAVRKRVWRRDPDAPPPAALVATRAALLRWSAERGLQWDPRGARCLHYLAGVRRCVGTAACRPGPSCWDHTTTWTRDGEPAALLLQPYGDRVSADDVVALVDVVEGFGAELHQGDDGWYWGPTVALTITGAVVDRHEARRRRSVLVDLR